MNMLKASKLEYFKNFIVQKYTVSSMWTVSSCGLYLGCSLYTLIFIFSVVVKSILLEMSDIPRQCPLGYVMALLYLYCPCQTLGHFIWAKILKNTL